MLHGAGREDPIAQQQDGGIVAVAAALYATAPADFVAERKQRAADARGAGDRDLAARIAALPKPSAAAGLVNRLLRDAPDDLDRVLSLGADLQAAQQEGDRAALRELTGQRRRLLDEVAAGVADREEQQAKRPGAAALEELQQTLQAAMAGAAAAAAVRSGRLVRALTADGLEPADLSGAVAPEGTLPDAEPAPRRAAATRAGGRAAPDDARAAEEAQRRAEAQRREEARQRADAARERARVARREADDAATRAEHESSRVDRRARAVDDLQDRLDELQQRLDEERTALQQARTAATRARDAAERAAATATSAEEEAARADAEA